MIYNMNNIKHMYYICIITVCVVYCDWRTVRFVCCDWRTVVLSFAYGGKLFYFLLCTSVCVVTHAWRTAWLMFVYKEHVVLYHIFTFNTVYIYTNIGAVSPKSVLKI